MCGAAGAIFSEVGASCLCIAFGEMRPPSWADAETGPKLAREDGQVVVDVVLLSSIPTPSVWFI